MQASMPGLCWGIQVCALTVRARACHPCRAPLPRAMLSRAAQHCRCVAPRILRARMRIFEWLISARLLARSRVPCTFFVSGASLAPAHLAGSSSSPASGAHITRAAAQCFYSTGSAEEDTEKAAAPAAAKTEGARSGSCFASGAYLQAAFCVTRAPSSFLPLQT